MANEQLPYLEVKDLPWNNNISDNTFNYPTVQNKSETNESSIYRFIPEKQMQGKGVLEMQLKLAYVFKYFWHDTFYKPYYMENEEYRVALTSGIYGPRTMEMIMQFQKLYLKREFKNIWDIEKGFGSFGEHTKNKLEKIFLQIRKTRTKEINKKRSGN